MTAIICAAQPRFNLVHVLTDAAAYRDGSVVCLQNKSVPLPQWPGVITCTGSAYNTTLFRSGLSEMFTTWDDLINGATSEVLRNLAKDYGMCASTVILAGISEERGPEIYAFDNDALLPAHISEEERAASPYYTAPYNLLRLPDVIMSPCVPQEIVAVANFEGIDVDADPEMVVWSMRKHLAMQRTMPLPEGIGGIGGWGELTTVSAEGVSHRIVDRWPADKVGAPLNHGLADWDAWHQLNPKPGNSRLRLVN